MQTLTLKLTQQQVDVLAMALGKAPLEVAFETFSAIKEQVAAQQKNQIEATPIETKSA